MYLSTFSGKSYRSTACWAVSATLKWTALPCWSPPPTTAQGPALTDSCRAALTSRGNTLTLLLVSQSPIGIIAIFLRHSSELSYRYLTVSMFCRGQLCRGGQLRAVVWHPTPESNGGPAPRGELQPSPTRSQCGTPPQSLHAQGRGELFLIIEMGLPWQKYQPKLSILILWSTF